MIYILYNEENIHLTTKVRPGIINIVENTQGAPDIIYPAVILACEKTFNQGVGRSSRPWVTILESHKPLSLAVFLVFCINYKLYVIIRLRK